MDDFLVYREEFHSALHTCLEASFGMARKSRIPPCVPDSHPYRVTNTRCRIGTVISPDDGHTVAQNMYRKAINILRRNCAPSWFYLQYYTKMQVNKT
jgi:hypothetical protein